MNYYYNTGWQLHLYKTSSWLQNKSSVLAWPGQARPKQNFCFEINGRFWTSGIVTLYYHYGEEASAADVFWVYCPTTISSFAPLNLKISSKWNMKIAELLGPTLKIVFLVNLPSDLIINNIIKWWFVSRLSSPFPRIYEWPYNKHVHRCYAIPNAMQKLFLFHMMAKKLKIST